MQICKVFHEAAVSVIQEARRHESQIARLSLTSKDCNNLMPGDIPDDQARIKALTEESQVLDDELVEVEAKNRLYTLLGERTRCIDTSCCSDYALHILLTKAMRMFQPTAL